MTNDDNAGAVEVALARSIRIKLLRLIVVVVVVTFPHLLVEQARPGDPVSKVKPFAQPAERRADHPGARPQRQLHQPVHDLARQLRHR